MKYLFSQTLSVTLAVLCGMSVIAPLAAAADAKSQDQSNDELAKELANPNTTLGTLNFNVDYVSYKGNLPGASSQDSWRLSFQPVLPYALNETTNLFVRPNIPVLIGQPVPVVNGADVSPTDGLFFPQDGDFSNTGTELGDISFDIAIGKTLPSKTILVGGMVGTLDTATDASVGLGQTLLGPEIAIAQITNWGVIGLLVTHQWDIAGDDDFDTSITGGQYFYTYNLSNGWQIRGHRLSPTITKPAVVRRSGHSQSAAVLPRPRASARPPGSSVCSIGILLNKPIHLGLTSKFDSALAR